MESIEKKIAEMKSTRKKRDVAELDGVQNGQLAMWPEQERRMPNELIRSALFTARGKTEKRELFTEKMEVYIYGTGQIFYRGEELRSLDDEMIWLHIYHLFRQVNVDQNEFVEFTTNDIIKEMNWQRNGAYYRKVTDCIERLQHGELHVRSERAGEPIEAAFSMIRKIVKVGKGGRTVWRVWLEPEALKLFKGVYYTKLEWERWKKLKPQGRKLDGWIRSHKQPYPISLDELKCLFGSTSKSERSFKQKVNKSMNEVMNVGKTVSDWWWDEKGRLCVKRDLSDTHGELGFEDVKSAVKENLEDIIDVATDGMHPK